MMTRARIGPDPVPGGRDGLISEGQEIYRHALTITPGDRVTCLCSFVGGRVQAPSVRETASIIATMRNYANRISAIY